MRLEPIAVAAKPAGSEAPAGEEKDVGFARLLDARADADAPAPAAHGKARAAETETDAEGIGQPAGSGVPALESTLEADPAPPLAALVPLPGSDAGLHPAEELMAEAGVADPRLAPGLRPLVMAAPMGDAASAGPAHAAPVLPAVASRAGPDPAAAARTGDPSAAPVRLLPPGALMPGEIAAAAVAAQRPAAAGRGAQAERGISKATAAGESALQLLGERAGTGSSPAPAAAQPSIAVMLQAQQGPFRNPSELQQPAPASAAPPASAPATVPESAMIASGPVQEIRLFAGLKEGLGVVLQVGSERDREEVQRETPALLTDLAGVGAKVEAIRVELAGRSSQETAAGAAPGQSPGSGPGAGHPGKEESPARRSEGSEPAVRGALAARPVDHGGKVDRYA